MKRVIDKHIKTLCDMLADYMMLSGSDCISFKKGGYSFLITAGALPGSDHKRSTAEMLRELRDMCKE